MAPSRPGSTMPSPRRAALERLKAGSCRIGRPMADSMPGCGDPSRICT